MEFFTEEFDAIGVTNQVTVVEESALAPAVAIARREVRALDDACSRFREDSELARLNRDGTAQVSVLLLDALAAALHAAEVTDGLVDPTVGGAMQAIGYDRDFDLIVHLDPTPRLEYRPATGWRAVGVDAATATVRLPRHTELDLGATAKAFASDRIAQACHAATGTAVLVSLGGDIAVVGPPPAEGWPILVTDDSRAIDAAGQVVGVRHGGLATSSTTVRRWRSGAVEMHHIVDPRTGAPANSCWRTVSVAAGTCLEANIASTAAIVLGPQAPDWLEARNLSARLVDAEGTISRTGGWPAAQTPPENTPTDAAKQEAIHS